MKRDNFIIFCLMCIFSITLSRFVPAQYRNLKQNLAIIDFENKTAFRIQRTAYVIPDDIKIDKKPDSLVRFVTTHLFLKRFTTEDTEI